MLLMSCSAVLYPLIDGGNVTYFVAAPNNIETVFFNLLESVTNLPVFLEWTESGNHTVRSVLCDI